MTVRLSMLGETHILQTEKKLQHSASGVREASRTQFTLCIDFRNGYDAYNCRYSSRWTNTFDSSGMCMCRHSVGQI